MMKNKNGEPVLGLTFWGLGTLKGVGQGTEIGKVSIGGRRMWVRRGGVGGVGFLFSGSSGRSRGWEYFVLLILA